MTPLDHAVIAEKIAHSEARLTGLICVISVALAAVAMAVLQPNWIGALVCIALWFAIHRSIVRPADAKHRKAQEWVDECQRCADAARGR